jgi:hypothetical protein
MRMQRVLVAGGESLIQYCRLGGTIEVVLAAEDGGQERGHKVVLYSYVAVERATALLVASKRADDRLWGERRNTND